jgi:hypothetical protein
LDIFQGGSNVFANHSTEDALMHALDEFLAGGR